MKDKKLKVIFDFWITFLLQPAKTLPVLHILKIIVFLLNRRQYRDYTFKSYRKLKPKYFLHQSFSVVVPC